MTDKCQLQWLHIRIESQEFQLDSRTSTFINLHCTRHVMKTMSFAVLSIKKRKERAREKRNALKCNSTESDDNLDEYLNLRSYYRLNATTININIQPHVCRVLNICVLRTLLLFLASNQPIRTILLYFYFIKSNNSRLSSQFANRAADFLFTTLRKC